jgi:sporulation protein YlmC with PRC-barrel domain
MPRLSELLQSKACDRDGTPLGEVEDVRLVQDGPILDGVTAAFRVDALIVSHRGFGIRLGYYGRRQTGPWLVRALMQRLERRSVIIEWDQVAAWDGNVVRVSATAAELPSALS